MTPNRNRSNRLLVVGLAEATFDLIEPWCEVGELPNLQTLMMNGSSARLRSCMPPSTPQMLANVTTGRTPGHHGLFDFWQRGPDGVFRETRGADIKSPTIWEILDQRQVPCGLINIPFTYPPAHVEGFMIAGEDAPGAHRSIAYPTSLYDELVKKFGRYRLKDIFPGGRDKIDYLTLIEDDVAAQTRAWSHLYASRIWQFGMCFFSATAIAQHYFWRDMASNDPNNPFRDVVRSAYRAVDAAIGRLRDVAGDDTNIFVISECGAGPLRAGVQMNTVLENAGLLARKKPNSNLEGSRNAVANLRKRTQRLLQAAMPDALYYSVNRYLGPVKSWTQSFLNASDVEWRHTRAFWRGKEGGIFINLAGRDPQGIVAPGKEYEDTCQDVADCFLALRDPSTGEPAVTAVHRAADLYAGPMLQWAPDVIIEWNETAYMPTEDDRNKDSVFVERWREYMNWPTSGAHRLEGVLIAAGPDIVPANPPHEPRLIDLVPTWLQCLGQRPPEDLEGRILDELLHPRLARSHS